MTFAAFAPLLAAGITAGAGLLGGGGKDDQVKQMPTYSPQQLEFINDLLQQAKSGNQNAFKFLNQILSDDPKAMEAFNAPAIQEFEEDIIPSILERFSGLGARNSSALNQTLGRAGETLATNLNSQRAQLKSNAINQLMGYSQMGLTPTTKPYIKAGMPSAIAALAPTAANLAYQGLNSYQKPSSGQVTSSGYPNNSPGNGMSNTQQMNQFGYTYG